MKRWYYAVDSHHFSLVLKAEVMRAYYIYRTLLHLHLISFNALIAIYLFFLSKQQLFQPPEAVFASFPIKPSQRNPADVLHNASKMQDKAELAETTFHSLTDVSTFTVCHVSLTKPCLLLSLRARCRSVECTGCRIRTERRFISPDSEQLRAGEKLGIQPL